MLQRCSYRELDDALDNHAEDTAISLPQDSDLTLTHD